MIKLTTKADIELSEGFRSHITNSLVCGLQQLAANPIMQRRRR